VECNNLDSSIEIVVSINVVGSRLFLDFVVEPRPVPRTFRKICFKSFTLFQTVDILRIISDQASAIAECADELVRGCGGLDILDFLAKTRNEHVEDRCLEWIRPDHGIEEIATFQVWETRSR